MLKFCKLFKMTAVLLKFCFWISSLGVLLYVLLKICLSGSEEITLQL